MRKKAGGIVGDDFNNAVHGASLCLDVLNLDVLTGPNLHKAGGMGTAMHSTVAVGLYKDFGDAVSNMVKMSRTYHPGENSRIYEQKFNRFKDLIAKLEQ